MNLLLVGGTGVLSSAVAETALAKGDAVTVINRGNRNASPGCEAIVSDRHDYDKIENGLGNRHFDVAIDFLVFNREDSIRSFEFYSKRCNQYVLVSSCFVYDFSKGGFVHEGSPRGLSCWKYSSGKCEAEDALVHAAARSGCGYTIVPKDVSVATFEGERIPLNQLWLRRQCTKFNGTSYISQRAAEAIYSPEGKQQVGATIDYYMQNAARMLSVLRNLGFECYGGENAPYIWMRVPDGTTSWQFFEQLLYGANVVCTPGVGFGPSGEGYVRFTAFGSHEQTEEALQRIAQWKNN